MSIDQYCPVTLSLRFSILREAGDVYVCSLNQADVVNNCNKSYLMQLLERAGETYVIYSRFGRVGQTGTMNTDIFINKALAIKEFKRLFKEKTGTRWADRYTDTTIHPGKYQFIIMKHDTCTEGTEGTESTEGIEDTAPMLTIDQAVQDFINVIYDPLLYDKEAKGYNIDTRKLPLGSLGLKQIKRAQDILSQISALIDKGKTDQINELSSLFYTSVPSTESKLRPIYTKDMVAEKHYLLDMLTNIYYMGEGLDKSIMVKYTNLGTNISYVTDPKILDMINMYMGCNVGATHHVKLVVGSVYEIDKPMERQSYRKWDSMHNKQLLWHGTRLANAVGILTTGFCINPTGVLTHGKMFGNGIYFANASTKSAGYLGLNGNGVGIMFLCEVALGNMYEKTHSEQVVTLPTGKHSTKGVGTSCPNTQTHIEIDDVTVPIGNLISSGTTSSLLYDEFVVYDPTQIKMRYAVLVEYKSTW